MTKKTVFIIGQSRSGLSMLTGILSEIGVEVNSNAPLLFKDHYPKGGFENIEINNLTTEMSKDVRRKALSSRKIAKKYEQRIRQYLDSLEDHPVIGIKSALMMYCLDYFLPFAHEPYLVFCARSPYTHALSFIKSVDRKLDRVISFEDAFLRICGENLDVARCLKAHFDKPYMFTSYEDIKRDPVGEARRLTEFLGLSVEDSVLQRVDDLVIKEHTTVR